MMSRSSRSRVLSSNLVVANHRHLASQSSSFPRSMLIVDPGRRYGVENDEALTWLQTAWPDSEPPAGETFQIGRVVRQSRRRGLTQPRFWLGVTAASIGHQNDEGASGRCTAHPFMGPKRLAGTASRR
jgi:hypothetical protein